MKIFVKRFSLDTNGDVLDSEGNIVTDLPPVDPKYILLVDSVDVSERVSGSEYPEQWYQIRIASPREVILADMPIKYNFSSVGHWTWENAKADILGQLNLVEREELS